VPAKWCVMPWAGRGCKFQWVDFVALQLLQCIVFPSPTASDNSHVRTEAHGDVLMEPHGHASGVAVAYTRCLNSCMLTNAERITLARRILECVDVFRGGFLLPFVAFLEDAVVPPPWRMPQRNKQLSGDRRCLHTVQHLSLANRKAKGVVQQVQGHMLRQFAPQLLSGDARCTAVS